MNSRQAQALLDNLANLKIKPRIKALFTVYLQGIANTEARDVASIIGRLPASQQLNINETSGMIKQFNTDLIARAGGELASIPDSTFDNPANELEADEQ